uniref:Asparagine synthetase [glutamine-hydrolyzing] n=1 Tax=Glossina palpalis gambiensis TaxID=67801 RepID=A0A1B0C614_9MUSC
MCAIFGILNIKENYHILKKKALYCSSLMSHRGPDSNGIYEGKDAILSHERLSIIDIKHGHQPIINSSQTSVLVMNGEIYNYKYIKKNFCYDYKFTSNSDCEVVLALYDKLGIKFLDLLNGMFSFILYDIPKQHYLIGRDHIGMVPLYIGYDIKKNLYVSSEMKALIPVCNTIKEFPPRSYLWSPDGVIRQYYYRKWFQYKNIEYSPLNYKIIERTLKQSVKMHLITDVPYGVLLSGGLDSAIIASIASKFIKLKNNKKSQKKKLKSFSIGLLNAPDLISARLLSKKLETQHYEIIFKKQEGLDAIRDVIYHIETYDITTVRASIPMYLMSKKIQSQGVKMVLSGEGADEIFGGYLYFHYAPNMQDFHEELHIFVSHTILPVQKKDIYTEKFLKKYFQYPVQQHAFLIIHQLHAHRLQHQNGIN